MQATEVIKRNLYRLFYIPILGLFAMLLTMCRSYDIKIHREKELSFITTVSVIQLFSLLVLVLSLIFK